jgi:hypothetical protein
MLAKDFYLFIYLFAALGLNTEPYKCSTTELHLQLYRRYLLQFGIYLVSFCVGFVILQIEPRASCMQVLYH